ncbi:MAG: flagellar type III secretion system pore protein FliP [Phycisphaerae bacterium]|nr:flagellar type III secretion system pore protein FliP [Phycisphaerae bacterium]
MDAGLSARSSRRGLAWPVSAGLAVVAIACVAASAQGVPAPLPDNVVKALPDVQDPGTAGSVVRWLVIITVLAVAPAVAVMVTCFTRIIVVLGLLRQALATPQLPPNQILFGLALLMTLVVMAPTYTAVHRQAVAPYLSGTMAGAEAWQAGQQPLRAFMIHQIAAAGNEQDVYLFLDKNQAAKAELTWSDVPTLSLIPAFAVSELKVAFLIGFRVYLPFVVIDMLVASMLISMSMLMVPPVLVSLPLKLLMFVLADGWHLVVGTLMTSFQ